MRPGDTGVGTVLASRVRYVPYGLRSPRCSAAVDLGMERCAITGAGGTAGHIFGLPVLLCSNDVRAVPTSCTIKPLTWSLCNFKMVEACRLVKT